MFAMGRHAAPGENEPAVVSQPPVPRFLPPEVQVPRVVAPMGFADAVDSLRPPTSRPLPRGRHSAADEDDAGAVDTVYVEVSGADTDRLPQPAPTGAGPEVERPPKARKQGATAADLHLLRTDPALRNRVIAAVLVPFVLFFLVLVLIGRLDVVAVWIWLPLISAGLGAGLLLDTGHARLKDDPEPKETVDAL
jgi:hypothetical protein